MARTTTLTVETVAAAAAELQAAGRSVTVAAVTEITGGSYTTVGRLLREWRGEAPAAPQAATDGEPQEIPAAVARALAAVGPAVTAALAEARADRDALARQVAALTAQLVAAKAEPMRSGAAVPGAEGQDLADCVVRLVGLVSTQAPAILVAWADEMGQSDGDRDRLAGGIAALRSLWDYGADGVEHCIAQARQQQAAQAPEIAEWAQGGRD